MSTNNQSIKSRTVPLRTGERMTLLLVGDILMAVVALFLGLYFWAAGDAWLDFSLDFIIQRPPLWFFLLPIIWLVLIIDLYDTRKVNNYRATIRGILIATAIGLVIYSAVYFTSPPKSLPRRGVAAFLVGACALTLTWRMASIRISTRSQASRRVMLVGAGDTGIALLKVINRQDPPPYQVLGIIDDDPIKQGLTMENYPVVGGSECLVEVSEQEKLVVLLVAISGAMHAGVPTMAPRPAFVRSTPLSFSESRFTRPKSSTFTKSCSNALWHRKMFEGLTSL